MDNLKVIITAEAIAKTDCTTLANYIAAEAGAELNGITSLENYNSTAAAWIRDEVCVKLLATLDKQRNNRNVWLCIKDLNKYAIAGGFSGSVSV